MEARGASKWSVNKNFGSTVQVWITRMTSQFFEFREGLTCAQQLILQAPVESLIFGELRAVS